SGCGEEEPLITERFIRFWAESGFPAQMDIEISELYLEDEELLEHEIFEEETFEEFCADNSLPFNKEIEDELLDTWHS
ncbi:hypothetical protein, partial [Pseudomonas fluorescens]|uniref:hypothetical protein n=1 Tax=Pseudomonas fluorescens TaxID=294 RepID=UPI002B1E5396